MKVIILVNHDMTIHKFRLELIDRLFLGKHQIYISSPNGECIEHLKELGCHYIETKLSRHSTSIKEDVCLIRFYLKLLKEIKPDIVLTYTIKPNVYGGIACQITKTPYISNITGLGTAVENGGLMSFITTNLYKIGLRHCDCIFFQNQANLTFFEQKKMRGKKKRLIPGSGVNLEKFTYLTYPREDTIDLLFIGRIMQDKGVGELLECAEYIQSRYDNITFSLIGFYDEDIFREKVELLAAQGILNYYGTQIDVRPFIQKASAIVLPSYHEGLSNVLLEASASGRPVLTSNVAGCKETFDEGVTGFGCDAKNTQSLIEIVEKFIHLPVEAREDMGRKAREKIEREFSRTIVIDAYLEEIERCSCQ